MKCPKCGYDDLPQDAHFCPGCGATLAEPPKPTTQVKVKQQVGRVTGGKVSAVEVGQVTGDLTVESTVNQIEKTVVQGDYVGRQTITNHIMVLGPEALEELAKRLAAMQGVGKQAVQNPGAQAVPEHVSRQITEVMAAQKEVAAQGMPASPQVAYRLGMLAAYNRDYDAALDYFRQATQADAEYTDAYESIAWLQQARARDDFILHKDYDTAAARLAEARDAARHTDPLSGSMLALRGYIAGTLAQLATARQDGAGWRKYNAEAARLFEQAVKLDPDDPSAQNGLGNAQQALGNLDAAITAYHRAIALAPGYASAYHDLALAYEEKMQADPSHADEWRRQALAAWRKAYQLAPEDPGFSGDYLVTIGQRINWLEGQAQ